MTDNTKPTYSTDTKIKVLAMYLGQQYYSNNKYQPFFNKVMLGNIAGIAGSRHKLLLRPISSLTDEECIEIYNKSGDIDPADTDEVKILAIRLCIEHDWDGISLTYAAQLTDYLRSIGVDLPNYHLGGKTLKEAGLAVYKEDMV